MSELAIPEEVHNFQLEEYTHSYRVVALGDSITASVRNEKKDRWTTLLQDMIARADTDQDVIVVNAGIGATTSRQGLERIERDLIPLKPHLVTICFALNDGCIIELGENESYTTKLTIEESRQCLREMVDIIRTKSNAKVILWTPNKVADIFQTILPGGKVTGAMRRRVGALYNQVLKEVAQEKNATLVDIGARFENEQNLEWLLHPDGIHPNKYGDLIIAGELFQKAQAVFEK